MSAFASDLRIAFRRITRNPGYALGLVATLALGIAVSAAMYSVVHGVIVKGLDYPQPDRLVVLESANATLGGEPADLSAAEAESLAGIEHGLESAGYYFWDGVTFLGGERPKLMTAIQVGGEFFRTLGVQPMLGRWLTREDQGGEGKVVLGHQLWLEQFGGDPDVVGKPFRTDGVTATIVGVMPPEFGYPARGIGLWFAHDPSQARADPALYRNARFFSAIGRVQEGVGAEALRGDLARHSQVVAETHGAALRDWRLQATPLLENTVGAVRPVLLSLLAIALLALLVACANVANLVVLRGVSRLQELGVHQALGASSGRLARLVFTETMLLGALATVAGIAIAWLALHHFVGIDQSGVPRAREVGLGGAVVAVSAAFGLCASLLAASVPAWRLRGLDAAGALRTGDARLAGNLALGRIGRYLPVAAGTFSVGGLAAALLLAGSVWRLERVPLGFDPGPVLGSLIFRVPDAQSGGFSRQVIERTAALPGVEAAAISSSAPMSGIGAIPVEVTVAGRDAREPLRPLVRAVDGPVQDVLGLALLRGRWFEPADREGAEPVVVVNQAFAERVFGNEDPVGRNVKIPPFGAGGELRDFRIVGVMADARLSSPARPPVPELWVPYAQYPVNSLAVLVRAQGEPGALARQVESVLYELRPDEGIYQTLALADVRDRMLATPRFFARNAGAFALLALLLAAIGVHSVVAFQMTQRRREFALRLALGSAPRSLAARVLRHGYALGLPAAVLGAGLGVGFGQVLRSAVVGVEEALWAVAGASALLMLAIVALACLRSMRAAMRVEPMSVLRGD